MLASCRSLSTSARSSRHLATWALTRGFVRGRVVWRHDLAGRSSLGRRALGSSTPRSPPYSSHAAGSPDSAAPAVSHTRLAAVAAFAAAAHCRCCHCCRSFARTSATDTGPSSASCRRCRCRRLHAHSPHSLSRPHLHSHQRRRPRLQLYELLPPPLPLSPPCTRTRPAPSHARIFAHIIAVDPGSSSTSCCRRRRRRRRR